MLRRGWDAWCVFWARARRNRNENENEPRQGGASTSKKLLAAIAVLAVAFVVFAAIPVAVDDSDATGSSYDDGIIAAGYVADKVTAKGIIDALSGKDLSDVDDSTMFAVFQSKAVTGYTLKVNGTDVTSEKSKSTSIEAGVHVIYFKVAKDAAAQDSVKEAWDATKTYKVEITLGDETYKADITGQTVTLYQDVNASSNNTTTFSTVTDDGKTQGFTSVVPVVSDLEIRLNGHDFSFDSSAAAFFVGDVVNSRDVSLKIVGGVGEQKDQMNVDFSGAAVYVASKGAFEVRNVDFNAGGYAVFSFGNASAVDVVGSDVSAKT